MLTYMDEPTRLTIIVLSEGVFQLTPPLSVIAQEINRVNGGLVLKPKLLCVKIGNNTHKNHPQHI